MKLRRIYTLVLLFALHPVAAIAQNLDITSVSPTPNLSYVPLDANITVSFDQPVATATLISANVVVRGSQTGVIAGVLTGGGTNTITFNATSNFKPGESISITITKNLIGLTDGQGLLRGHTYSFTTITGPSETTLPSFGQRNITYSTGLAPNTIKTMDIENDGDIDLVFGDAMAFGEGLSIGLNDGTGRFCISSIAENRIADLSDLDGDADKDAISLTSNSQGLSWNRNDGGVFTEVVINSSVLQMYGATRNGDIDSDGDVDFVVGLGNTGMAWYENNGSASFTPRVVTSNRTLGNTHIEIADVNADGAMDVVAYRFETTPVLVWYENNGAQVFTEHIITSSNTYLLVATADLDDDGDIDILTTNRNNTPQVTWYQNDGNENFTAQSLNTLTNAEDGIVRVVDLDGDLDKDVIGGGQWLENNGSEVFTPRKLGSDLQQSSSVDYADIDNDGDLDLFFGGGTLNKQMLFFENTKFMNVTAVTPLNGSHSVQPSDNITITFNQPIDPGTANSNSVVVRSKFRGVVQGALSVAGNIITFNPATDFLPGDEVSVAVNHFVRSPSRHRLESNYGFDFMIKVSVPVNSASFQTSVPAIFTYSTAPVGMEMADLDNDGDLDLVSASASELRWHRNDGTGNFTTILIPTTGTNTFPRLTDYNRDGRMDIIVYNQATGETHLFPNDASQSFTSTIIPRMNQSVSGFADVDRDGYDDNLSGRYMHRNCDQFTQSVVGSVSSGASWAAGDLDGDGIVDLIKAGVFHRGDGGNGFFNLVFGGGIYSARADVDGDGDLDPIIPDASAATRWYPNNLNTASANFGTFRSIPSLGDSRSMATADFDGDGDIDLAGAGSRFGLTMVRNSLNETSANFILNQTLVTAGNAPFVVEAGDLNGDGKIDLAGASTTDRTIRWFPNTGVSIGPPTITSLSTNQGTEGSSLQINGTNFSPTPSNNIVRFNGTAATVNSSNATRIFVTVPTGATKGFVTVTVGSNTATSPTEYSLLPEIIDFDPAVGPVGTQVIVNGSRFGPESRIYFDGTEAVITARTLSSITTTVPAGATTGYIEVHTSEGIASSDDADFVVTTGNVIQFDGQTPDQLVCPGTTVSFAVSAYGDTGLTYQWMFSTTAAGPFTPVSGSAYSGATTKEMFIATTGGIGAGYYLCEVRGDNAGPVVSDAVQLLFSPVPAPPSTTGSTGCAPQALTLTASGTSDGSYLWYSQSTGGTPIAGAVNSTFVTPALSTTTTYYVSIVDACESVRTPVIATIVPCNPPVITSRTLETQIGGTITIDLIPLISTASLDIASLKVVQPPPSGALATIDHAGVLTIDYAGQTFAGSETVAIEACDLNGRCSAQTFSIDIAGEIEVYNAVSPEGKNPILLFRFIDTLPDTRDNQVVIYNRWGDAVFEVSNYNNTTNVFAGLSSNGNKLPSGTYFYKVTFGNGRESMTGFLELRY